MGDTALVLGAGGITGVGWEIGMLYGLAEAGVDVTGADLVVGSSAGSVVAAQITSGRIGLPQLYERQLARPAGEVPANLGPAAVFRFARAALTSRTPEEYGRKLGRVALAGGTGQEAARREVIAGRLVSHEWPARRLRITAVAADSGELRIFDRESGVELVDAVAASCAVPGVWPAVTVEGRRWIDGGVHSPANAQLAAGYDRVLVLAPLALGGGPLDSPRTQVAALSAAGTRVELITPDSAARRAFGRNSLEPSRRAPAARAGRTQAAAHAAAVRKLWS
ncbi:patatin-like phospholipase family protein [Streptomyces sp. BPTC-684]|uniref:patatin-like phospholipase family protein n=1 Tax=Streptomyces sp. BPTC-684 TaxID=3043734 RepID=UPI0024B070A9|nr:patatin-like phospholipase family protein [Streptomyces sp. BPTC-684]WHM39836.1 patatin-like phospholipase family protein [Streptomyces sp. BPTC-684]